MSNVYFHDDAFKSFCKWSDENHKIFKKIQKLIAETSRTPFSGTGKPEPLKGNRSGYWSRRITDEHRLIYCMKDGVPEIISCEGHYDN